MKINPSNYLAFILFNKAIRHKMIKSREDIIRANTLLSKEDYQKGISQTQKIFSANNNQNYLLSKSSAIIIKKIIVSGEKFDGRMFAGLKEGRKITILIDKYTAFRYLVEKDCIYGFIAFSEEVSVNRDEDTKHIGRFNIFKIDTETGQLTYFKNQEDEPIGCSTSDSFESSLLKTFIKNQEDEPIGCSTSEAFESSLFKTFIQTLIFLEFSELETVTVKPNGKIKTVGEGKILNGTNYNIVIVDSTWNKKIIVAGEFSVSGHLRFQPYGANRQRRKLIYIDEFKKQGYVRNAKKELEQGKAQMEGV